RAQPLVPKPLDIALRFHIKLPTKYFLIPRGLITVEGTGRELYPDFNVFEVAEPYVRRMAQRRFSARTLAGENVERAGDLAGLVSRYPYQLSELFDQLQDTLGEAHRLEELLDAGLGRTGKFFNRVAAAIFLAALIV